jgi:hypothetical protein
MVYTLKDLKHLETIASLQSKEVEQSKPIFAQAEDTSLISTLLKLCNKLRAEGYNKYAESIENKFVNYKTAGVHLYQAHKETGEDLVDQAHPDGDNKIVPDVSDNNGDVETIVSKHKKIVDIVNKQPTGKLALYVEQCKMALGSTSNDISIIVKRINNNIDRLSKLISGAGSMTDVGALGIGTPLYTAKAYLDKIKNLISATIPSVKEIEEAINFIEFRSIIPGVGGIMSKLEPSFLGTGVDEAIWPKVKTFLDTMANDLKQLKTLSSQYYNEQSEVEQEKPTTQQLPTDSISENFQTVVQQLSELENKVNASNSPNKAKQLAWLSSMKEFVIEKSTQYFSSANKETLAKTSTDILDQVKERLDAFKSKLG